MASLTVDELKRVLAENNIPLPPGRSKKEDYVRLYEEHIAGLSHSDSLGFSDSEETTANDKMQPFSSTEVPEDISQLSNDALYEKLIELGVKVGPVVCTTRSLYEKKLANFLRQMQNGFSEFNSEESQFSDTETDLPAIVTTKRSSVLRDSPGPREERQPSVSRRRDSTPQKSSDTDNPIPILPTRVAFIESIPRSNPAQRFIEPLISEEEYVPSMSRWNASNESSISTSRYRPSASEHPQSHLTSDYVGRWSPNIGRYTNNSSKISSTGKVAPQAASNYKTYFAYIALGVAVCVAVGLVYQQWSDIDPYKLIQDDADAEISTQDQTKF